MIMPDRPVIDPSGPELVYVQVAEHIESPDLVRRAAVGTRLPAERDLATEYQVALGTMRRAIEELRSRGLVVTLPAKGTFVVAR